MMRRNFADTFELHTPDGVAFSIPLAGPVARLLALAVDQAVVGAGVSVCGGLLGVVGLVSRDAAIALTIVVQFVVSVGYGIVAEWCYGGRTVGKKMLGLRVVDTEGGQLRLPQVVIRNLLRPVDQLPSLYLVGGLSTLVTGRRQRLGDLAANTVVVRASEPVLPDFDQMLADHQNSLRNHPHLAARLRSAATGREARLALEGLMRRDGLEPDARINVFGRLADHFRSMVTFPVETVEGLSDEQYVRDVVDILYRHDIPRPRVSSVPPREARP